jgi:hypothetical protein
MVCHIPAGGWGKFAGFEEGGQPKRAIFRPSGGLSRADRVYLSSSMASRLVGLPGASGEGKGGAPARGGSIQQRIPVHAMQAWRPGAWGKHASRFGKIAQTGPPSRTGADPSTHVQFVAPAWSALAHRGQPGLRKKFRNPPQSGGKHGSPGVRTQGFRKPGEG